MRPTQPSPNSHRSHNVKDTNATRHANSRKTGQAKPGAEGRLWRLVDARFLVVLVVIALLATVLTVTAYMQGGQKPPVTLQEEVRASSAGKTPTLYDSKTEIQADTMEPSVVTANTASSANYAFATNATSSLALDLNSNVVDMTTGTTTLSSSSVDEGTSAATNIGFDFYLMGNRYSQFNVTTNGLVSLSSTGTTASGSTYVTSGGTTTTPIISAFAADLGTGTSGKTHYKLIGTAPNRTLVIEFNNMTLLWTGSFTNDGTYQVRLYESTGIVEFVYGTMSITSTGSASDTTVGIGFSTAATTNNLAYVTSSTNTSSTTATFTDNPIYPTGAITNLNSAANGSRRTYRYTPPQTPSPPIGTLTFTAVTPASMTLNWGDAPTEVGYAIYRSTDGGTTYSFFGSAASDAVSFNATGLTPSTTYFWRVFATSEGALSTALQNSQATTAPGNITSNVVTGNWSSSGTWSGGVVPTAGDNVTIANGATVTIDIAANAYSLTVGQATSGILQYETTTARALTVGTDVTIASGGTFRTGAAGAVTTHSISIGGNLTNNGTLDFSTTGTSANSAAAGITFTGATNNTFGGTGAITDIRTLAVNKGADSSSILEITASNLTVQGASTDSTAAAFLTLTNGTLKISGTFTANFRTFTAAAYTIGTTAGIWLNNPNYTVTGQAGSPTNNGLMRVSAGTFNVGSASGNAMGAGVGAVFTFEGGTTNFSGRLNVANAVTYTQTGGTINVCTVGNGSSVTYSFSIPSGTFTMSGGTINLVQINSTATAANRRDYQVVATPNITGGTLNVGTAATTGNSGNFDFRIFGYVPNLVVDNSTNAKNALAFTTAAAGSTALVVFGNTTVNTGASLNANGFLIQQAGSAVTNNGSIVGTVASSRFDFVGTAAQTYGGTGTFGTNAAPFGGTGVGVANTSNVTLNGPIITTRVNLFTGQFNNSNQISLGAGGAASVFVQRGGGGGPSGSFDVAPTFNLGTGTYQVTYTTATTPVTTSVEIPATRTLTFLTINNTNGVTLAGGDLTVNTTFTLTIGNLSTASNSLIVGSAGTVSRTSGHVIGNLRRTFTAASTITFDVGTANGYSPVAVNATSGTFPANFTASATQGSMPGISGANKLARYWTLTSPGVLTANLTFTYLAGDVTGTVANYQFIKNSGGTLSTLAPTGTPTSTSAVINGVSSFSDWTLAEPSAVLPGSLQFAAAPYTDSETNADHTFTVNVSRTGGSDGNVSVNYAVTDGTATTTDSDYTVSPASGTFTWLAGDSANKSFNITVKGDPKFENDETINLTLSTVTGGAVIGSPNPATLTITNDDTAPSFTIADVSQAELNSGSSNMVFTVTKSGNTAVSSTVNYSTTAGTATQGTCGTSGVDYTGTSGLLTFAPGDTAMTIPVPICGDTTPEPDETFTVNLATPANATLGSPSSATGTIQNDDGAVTYTWSPTVGTDWINPLNWSPIRPTAALASTTDILIFNGSVTPAPTVTNVPTQTISSLQLINGVNGVTLNAAGAVTLTLNGGTGSDLSVAAGTLLTLNGANAITLSLTGSGQQGVVAGQIILQGGGHRLLGANAGEVVFSSGSLFTTASGFTGNPFGIGTDDSVRFQSGSSAFFNAGGDPFGGSGHSITTFNSGSSVKYLATSAFSFENRTYGNLILDGSQTYSAGSAANQMTCFNDFEIGAGSTLTLSSAAGGDLNLLGNFTDQNSAAGLNPNGRAVKFQGAGATQLISKASNPESFFDVFISKTGGSVRLGSPIVINGQLQFGGSGSAVDVLDLNTTDLTLNGTIGAANANSGVKGDLLGSNLVITGTGALGTVQFVSGGNLLTSLVMNRAGSATFAGSFSIGAPAGTPFGLLSLANGTVDMSSNTLTVNPQVSVSRTSGYVIGNVAKVFGATGSFTFPVGTANGYSPVDANATAGTFPATLNVKAVQGQQPNISGTNALQRYWTLGGSGITANLTFHYSTAAPNDVVGTEGNYKIFKYNGSFTQFTPDATGSNSPQDHFVTLNNVSSFSDWTLAEPASVAGQLQFSAANYNTPEGDTGTHNVTVTVTRTGGTNGAVSIHYATSNGTATLLDNDYTAASGDLMWPDGDATPQTFMVSITGDAIFEPDETINLTLSAPTGGAVLGSPAAATITIQNDDTACVPPATVYVDDDWAGTPIGTDPDGTGPATKFGCDSFATIQNGVNGVTAGGTVNVYAGAYVENVLVNKSVSVLGPNAAINPNTGSRVAEAIVVPAVSETSVNASSSGTVFRVGTNAGHINVTIKGFTINGDNTSLAGGRTLNGAEVNTGCGICNSNGSFDTNPGAYDTTMIVQNNIIKNLERYGVLIDNIPARPGVAGNDVSFNKIDNLPSGNNFGGGRGRGIAFEENTYGSATYNVITRVNVGWQDDNNDQASPGAGTVIDHNDIHAYHRGIFHNLQYSAATDITITNNNLFAETTGDFAASTTNFGLELASIQSAVGATVTGNNSTGNVYGILLWNLPTTANIVVTGGTLSGNQYGVFATSNDPQFGAGSASHAAVSGVTITGATVAGVGVEDSPVTAATALEVSGNTTITTSATAISVVGAGASANVHDNVASIHNNTTAISVDGGSATITKNQIYSNGTSFLFGTTGTATAHFNRIISTTTAIANPNNLTSNLENNWWGCNAGPGNAGCGAVTGTGADFNPWIVLKGSASPNPTTPGGTSTVTADMTQNSDNVVPVGGPIPNVADSFSTTHGTMNPTTGTITNGSDSSLFTSTDTSNAMATITVDGQAVNVPITLTSPVFSIDDVTHNEGNGGPGTTSYTFTITKTGATAFNTSVDYATVDGTATSPSDFTAITTTNVVFLPTDTAKQFIVFVNGDTAYEGDEAFTVHLSNASGATISDADGLGTITNDDACAAFATVYVDDSWVGTPLGSDPDGVGPATSFGCDSFATIQGGVNGVTAGGTVNVAAGNYVENVTIPKALTLTGAGAGSVFVYPAVSNPNCGGAGGGSLCAGGSNIILVQASNVTISGMTLDGDNTTLTSGQVFGGADIDARNGIITNHLLATYNNLEVHHTTVKNIWLRGMYASSGGSFNFHDNTVQNVQASAASIGMFNFGGAGAYTNNNVSACNDAISSNHSRGTTYTGNTITTSASGIHSDNAGDSGGTNDTISGNTVTNSTTFGYGVWAFVPYKTVHLNNNTVTNVDVGTAVFGDSGVTTSTKPGGAGILPAGGQDVRGPGMRPAPVSANVAEPDSPAQQRLDKSRQTPNVPPTAPFAASFTGNTIDGQNKANSTGAYFTTSQIGFGSGNPKVEFKSNTVINNVDGFFLEAETGFTLETAASFNRIVNNTNSQVTQNTGGGFAGTLNGSMENNWWGCNAGPNNAGCGSVVGAGVDFDPWLVLGTSASPNPITPGATSTVTADMTHNSDALVPSAINFVPPVGVSFTATQGTILPASGTITAGQAASTFTSTSASSGTACAMVDNQQICTPIGITQPSFSIDDVTHMEGNPPGSTSYTFTITKTGTTAFNTSVDYASVDGTATSPSDFTAIPLTNIVFSPSDVTRQVTVLINRDLTVEPDEAFTIHLSGASGATISDADGTGTIQNDDFTPDYTVTTTVNSIVVSDVSGNSDTLTMSEPSFGNIKFAAPGRFFSVDGGPLISGDSGILNYNGIAFLTVNQNAGDDQMVVTTFSHSMGEVTINGGIGNDTVHFNGTFAFQANRNLDVDLQNDDPTPGVDQIILDAGSNLSFNGNGGPTLKASKNIIVNSGAVLQVSDGNAVVEGNRQATPTVGDFNGVDLIGGTVQTVGAGNVFIKGTGGAGDFIENIGVQLSAGGKVHANAAGTLDVQGNGGNGSGSATSGQGNLGVYVTGSGSKIDSTSAAIAVTGTGGTTNDSNVLGITVDELGTIETDGAGTLTITGNGGTVSGGGSPTFVNSGGIFIVPGDVNGDGGSVKSTGAGANAGAIIITGTAANGGNGAAQGVRVDTPASVTTVDGPITITGTSATCGNACLGTSIRGPVAATGTGAISITGTGGTTNGAFPTNGVNVRSGGAVTANNGNITITATAGSGSTTPDNLAFRLAPTGIGTLQTTGTGNIIVVADSMQIGPAAAATINAAANSVTLRPLSTSDLPINLGSATDPTGGPLSLSDFELDRITVAGTINIGDTNSGAITVSSPITRPTASNLVLRSDLNIDLTSSLNSNGGDVTLLPGSNNYPLGSGVDVTTSPTKTLTLAAFKNLLYSINSTTVDTGYTQLNVAGLVNLNNAQLALSGSYVPVGGETFIIVNNDSNDAISGTFNSLPEGSIIPNFLGSGRPAKISYIGGDGNDAVLTVIPCPTSFTVNSNGDAGDASTGDGVCATAGAVCTLRAAIQEANASGACGPVTINFNIGSATITVGSELQLSHSVNINGPTAQSITVASAGGSRVFNTLPGQTVSLSNLTVSGGRAGIGAGLLAQGPSSNTTLIGMLFTGNIAVDGAGVAGGGGAATINGGTLNIINSTVSGNTGTNGGGILILGGGPLNLVNATVTNNNADGNTGAGPCAVDGDGGGIGGPTMPVSGISLRNSIVTGNQDCNANNPNITVTGGFNNQGNNLTSGNSLLGPLQNNGGPTLTHALLALSPAIDAGNDCVLTNVCVPPVGFNITTDQRGFARPAAGSFAPAHVDIGAFEKQTPSATDSTVGGRIVDSSGDPVAGAAVRMHGTQNRMVVTDSEGNYRFEEVEAGGFYTITPTRSNFTFLPVERSFSQLGQHTDALFTASATSGFVNPLDTTEFFVRQQYLDFLGREPDEAGLNFWVTNIDSCGASANCLVAKRVDTSAAFFLSIEFHETGYFAYRLHQSAFGDLPGAPVPVDFNTFRADTGALGAGLIVNAPGWQDKLEANKQAFLLAFVWRARFVAAYPEALTPGEFVDKLFLNARVTPDDGDRAAAISEFGSAPTSADVAARGRALRRVAENSVLERQQSNQAFVLMQYFGYLLRDANSGPDSDFSGYDFWLAKLNAFNGDFREAEMVKAFLVSGEYRARFRR